MRAWPRRHAGTYALSLPMFCLPPGEEPGAPIDVWLVVGLGVVSPAPAVALGPAWCIGFVFSTVAAAVRMPSPRNARAVIASPFPGVGASVLPGVDDPGSMFGYAVSAPGVGLLIIGQLRRTNAEARAALAERAVAEERIRFARDLHDLLGTHAQAGNGLVGQRERVEALRRSLESGRLAEGDVRPSVRLGGAAWSASCSPRTSPWSAGRSRASSSSSRTSPWWRRSVGATRCSAQPPSTFRRLPARHRDARDDRPEAAELLARDRPQAGVLVLTTFGRPGSLRRATQHGASGFLLEDVPASQLANAIRRVMGGERVVDHGLIAAAARSRAEAVRRADDEGRL